MDASEQRVLVVGGGIGGVSAALGLQRAGVPVTVFERAAELSEEFGAGIQIWMNGMLALRELGVADVVAAAGCPIESEEFRSWRGPSLMRLPVGQLARELGIPGPVMVRRSALMRALTDALDEHDVRRGATCVGFEQDADGVTVRLADGREERGAVLVGADGVRSGVRTSLVPAAAPRYAGYQYLRAMTRSGANGPDSNCLVLTFGRGDRLGVCDAGEGWSYFFAVILASEGTSDSAAGRKADLLARFGRFHAPIPQLIEETPDAAILRHDIYDLEPLAKWSERRVTLLGDAAHAMTPNLGRGASESLEDSAALATVLGGVTGLSRGEDIRAALETYEARRREPSARVRSAAWRIGRLASLRNPLLCEVREQVMRRITPKVLRKEILEEFGDRSDASARR